jgi:hypothetical protein
MKIRPRYRRPPRYRKPLPSSQLRVLPPLPVARSGDTGLMERCNPGFGQHVWRVHPEDGVACRTCGLPLRATLLTNETAPRTRAQTPYQLAVRRETPTASRGRRAARTASPTATGAVSRLPRTGPRPPITSSRSAREASARTASCTRARPATVPGERPRSTSTRRPAARSMRRHGRSGVSTGGRRRPSSGTSGS